MPRLDNTSGYVVGYFYLNENFNPDDPGDNPPIDFCADCWLKEVISNNMECYEVEHPPYIEGDYSCFECAVHLTAEDDTY